MLSIRPSFLPAMMFGALLLVAGAALAQSSAPPAQQEQQQTTQFSEQEIDSFVVAALSVQEIGGRYQDRLMEARTPEEQTKIQEEARQEMISAVQDTGLSVEKYGQILNAAQADLELRETITEKMQEVTQEQ